MTLTPFQKFLVFVVAGIVTGAQLVWTGIKIDALALGLNENAYNIGQTILTIATTGTAGLLALLGLKAPTQ